MIYEICSTYRDREAIEHRHKSIVMPQATQMPLPIGNGSEHTDPMPTD